MTTHGFQNHAVRSSQWRYIRYADGSEQLYDHQRDPYEWTNLAKSAEVAEILAQHRVMLPTKEEQALERRSSGR